MAARKKSDDTEVAAETAVEAVAVAEDATPVVDGEHRPPDPAVYQPDGRPVETVTGDGE